MLTLVITATLIFIGVPLLLINSLMKSEEKQMDLLLYNLGGSRAVNERASKNRTQKSVKVTNTGEQRVAVLPESAKVKSTQPSINKTRVNSSIKGSQPKKSNERAISNKAAQNKKQTTEVIQAVTPNKRLAASTQEQVDLEFRLKLQIAYVQTKNRIAKNVLAIRKKMPGYVYPSRQEMLLDQRAKENVPSDK